LELHFKHCADELRLLHLNFTVWVVLNRLSALSLNLLVARCVGTSLCLSTVLCHPVSSSKSLQRITLPHNVNSRPP